MVHNKVKHALELTRREEMNKSLQTLFKEMNDHTSNTFEFGKLFLAYLLFFSKKIGANLTTCNDYDGLTIESGKFHYLLERTTHVVFDTYVKDMEQTQNRISRPLLTDNSAYPVPRIENGTTTEGGVVTTKKSPSGYNIMIRGFETSMTSTVFVMKIEDPKGHQWVTKRTWTEFETFHNYIMKEMSEQLPANSLIFPEKKMTLNALTNSADYNESLARLLDTYCIQLLGVMAEFNTRCQTVLAKLLDTKFIIITGGDKLHYAESIPNAFLPIRNVFQKQVMGKIQNDTNVLVDSQKKWFGVNSNAGSKRAEAKEVDPDETFVNDILNDKELDEFRRVWGVEYCIKIFDAYSLLQRMATVLGWTLEINQFFIGMFGNSVTFSRLPLRDIIMTLKELLIKFLALSNDLYQFACQLNAESKYKWHKNMQMAENELGRVKFHVEKALGIITVIETDHLDYEAQMRRLKDVFARFQPFMSRVGPSLTGIASELGLPPPQYTFSDFNANDKLMPGNQPLLLKNGDVSEYKDDRNINIYSNDGPRVEELDEDGMNDAPPKRNVEMTQFTVVRNEESSSVCVIS